jgi:hypothetical protein
VRWPLAMFVIVLGLFGAVSSAKQYERFCLHMNRASAYRNELQKRLQPAEYITELKRVADNMSAWNTGYCSSGRYTAFGS